MDLLTELNYIGCPKRQIPSQDKCISVLPKILGWWWE
jgi:hypothetical protein